MLLNLMRWWARLAVLAAALRPDQLEVRWGQLVILYPVRTDNNTSCSCEDCTDQTSIADGHSYGENCPCDPMTIPVKHPDGAISWVVAHRIDPDTTPADQAERAATIFESIDAVHQDDDP